MPFALALTANRLRFQSVGRRDLRSDVDQGMGTSGLNGYQVAEVGTLRGMGWLLMGVLVVGLILAWVSYMKSKEGKLPTRVSKPQPLGRGFRASSESDLTRLSDTGYRVRSTEDG